MGEWRSAVFSAKPDETMEKGPPGERNVGHKWGLREAHGTKRGKAQMGGHAERIYATGLSITCEPTLFLGQDLVDRHDGALPPGEFEYPEPMGGMLFRLSWTLERCSTRS